MVPVQCSICQKTSGGSPIGEHRRCEDGGTAGAEGVGCSERVWGSIVSSPAGSGAKPRPQTHFKHILGSQSGSGRRKNATFSAELTNLDQ